MADVKIVWIMVCTLISNSAYALVAPFLPIVFKQKGISGQMIGLIFAIYSIAVIICSPFVGRTVEFVGNATMISLGIAVMGLAFVLFGFIPDLGEMSTILVVSFLLRFLQGAASAFVQTTCYSIATNEFPDRKEYIIGWVEALTGLGLIVGPIIGSTLYSLLGYQQTFFIYGSFLILLSIIIKLNFVDELGSEQELEDDFLSEQRYFQDELSSFKNETTPSKGREMFISKPARVTIFKLLCSARYTMAALSSALCYFSSSFMEPILAERLLEFNLSQLQIGAFFSIWPIAYIPASIAVQYFPHRIDKRLIIILSALFTGVAFVFVGPSEIFDFRNSLLLMGVGQALVGIFTAFMMIPGLPEMVESTLPLYPGQEREVNNLSAGIYNSFLGFGQVFAPAYGAVVSEAVGFRMTSDIVAFICIFFAISYFLLAGGCDSLRKTCKRTTRIQLNDNDFTALATIKQEDEETKSHHTQKSKRSIFFMLGPTSPGVASFRMQNTYEIMSPVFVVQITENNLSHASSFFGPKRGLRKLYSTAERVGVLDSPQKMPNLNESMENIKNHQVRRFESFKKQRR